MNCSSLRLRGLDWIGVDQRMFACRVRYSILQSIRFVRELYYVELAVSVVVPHREMWYNIMRRRSSSVPKLQ